MFIIKDDNGGKPYWLLKDFDTGEDLPRTVLEESAHQFKTRASAERAVNVAFKRYSYKFRGYPNPFEIIDLNA